MLQKIYAMSLWATCFLMLLLLIGWTFLCRNVKGKTCAVTNAVLSCIIIIVILYVTFFNRTPGGYQVNLRPLSTLAAAQEQPELYREMLMNVFLFFPLGLTLSNALPRKLRLVMRIGVTTLAGFLLSVGIELTQYVCSVGMAETDDVICNTMGAFLGAMSLLVSLGFENIRKVFGRKSS